MTSRDVPRDLNTILSELAGKGLTFFAGTKQFESKKVAAVPLRASAARLQAPAAQYMSRLHAIAEVDEEEIPPLASLLPNRREGSSLVLFRGGQKYIFTGKEALSRLSFISPFRFENNAAALACCTPTSFMVVLHAKQLARFVAGSAPSATPRHEILDREMVLPGILRIFDGVHRERNKRFYTGVSRFHLQGMLVYLWCQLEYPDEAEAIGILTSVLTLAQVETGRHNAPLVEQFRDQVEGLHQEMPNPGTFVLWLRQLPRPLAISIYRLRRGIFKDSKEGVPLMLDCVARRQLGSFVFTAEQDALHAEVIDVFHEKARHFLQQNEEWARNAIQDVSCHKSSASPLFSRSQNGAGAEVHLWVGLKRLSQGIPSRISNVFGDLPENCDWSQFQKCVNPMELKKIRTEIYEAADYLMDCLDSEIMEFDGIMMSITPERETKPRTFVLEYPLLDIVTRPVLVLARRFLSLQPETQHVMGKSDNFDWITTPLRKGWKGRSDTDSSVSTDSLRRTEPEELLAPFIQFVNNPVTTRAFQRICGKRTVGLAVTRPDLTSVTSRNIPPALAWLQPFQESPKKAVPKVERSWKFDKPAEDYPDVQLRNYTELMNRQLAKGCFILKAPTGFGKTTMFCANGRVILTLPAIAQVAVAGRSLLKMGITNFRLKYKGINDPPPDFDGAIICTPAYAVQFSDKRPDWLVVSDEGETPNEDIHANHLELMAKGRLVVISTATPEQLKTSLPVCEIKGETRFPVTDEDPIKLQSLVPEIQGLLVGTDLVEKYPNCKILILTYSEPHCLALAAEFEKIGIECGTSVKGQSDDELEQGLKKQLFIATNTYRSSVTIEDLTHVFDLQIRYVFIIDPRTGTRQGVRVRIGVAGQLQGRGRVGRVGPGFYRRVLSGTRLGSESSTYETSHRTICLQRRFNLGSLTLEPSMSSYIKSLLDVLFWERVVQAPNELLARGRKLKFFDHKRDPVKWGLEKIVAGDGERERMILYHMCLQLQLDQRIRQFSRSNLPEFEELRSFVLDCAQFPIKAYYNALRVLEAGGVCHREIDILMTAIDSDLNLEDLEPYFDRRDLDSEHECNMFAFLNWQQTAQVKGKLAYGLIHDFTLTIDEDLFDEDGYYVFSGIHYTHAKTLAYARAVPFPNGKKGFDGLWNQVQDDYELSFTENLSFPTFHLDVTGKSQQDEILLTEGPPKADVLQPEELDSLLLAINDTLVNCCETVEQINPDTGEKYETKFVILDRGVNMGSEPSFVTLNGSCAGCVWAALKRGFVGRALVWGDDAIYDEETTTFQFANCVAMFRAAFGYITNMRASGFQTQPESLSVFTERFIDGHGNEFSGPKPSTAMRLAASMRPELLFSEETYDPEDFHGVQAFLERDFPKFVEANKLRVVSSMRNTRTTHTRALAIEIAKSLPNEGEVEYDLAATRTAIKRLDALLVTVTPSTRGPPMKEPIKASIPFRLTLATAKTISDYCDHIKEAGLHDDEWFLGQWKRE